MNQNLDNMSQNLDNAVADMKRQLRQESKSYLIRTWIGLYAQVIQLSKQTENLIKEIEVLKNQKTGSGDSELKESADSGGVQSE